LAIAFILAIAAALAAPAYVNWGDWRANFESHATALAGAPVRIRGKIEAKLLPTPAFLFRDVDIGDPEKGTGVQVGEVRGVLSLGALLRGTFEAEEFVLVRPAARVGLSGTGNSSEGLRAAAAATGLVALSRVSIERGSLVIDRGGEQTILDDIYAEGEMRSRQGPMRIDAVFRRDSRRWGLKANLGQLSEGRGRMRLTLEHAGAGTMFDADGTISFAGVAPRFEGKLVAGRRAAPGVPWQIAANAKATEESVLLESFELSLGANATPAELVGRIAFEPRRGGKIDGTLRARRIDLDLTTGGESAKGLPASFASLREVLALLDQLPLRGRIGLSVDALAAGGGSMREVKADIGLREHSLALERLEAKLPGRGSLSAAGASEGDALFLGDAKLEAEDAAAFARWAFGDKSLPLEDAGALLLAGKVDWRNGRVRMDGLTVMVAPPLPMSVAALLVMLKPDSVTLISSVTV
jgi:large subunit ribosomal protein L24